MSPPTPQNIPIVAATIFACSPRRMLRSASRMSTASAARVVHGIVFDMDGTCTRACIDFAEMRRRAGILAGDILAVLDTLPQERRLQSLQAIEEVELEALDRMQLMPGLTDLCEFLDSKQIPRGLITRNSQASVDHFHSNHMRQAFQPALCRDFRPYKPSPVSLLHICKQWQIPASKCLMVGDSIADDVVSGNRAGALTALLDVDGAHGKSQELQGELRPTFIVKSLAQLAEVLRDECCLTPPESH